VDLKFWLGNLSEWLGVVAVVMIAGTSPMLKKARQVEFKYPRRESNMALSLFVLVYVFAFIYFHTEIFNFLKAAADGFPGGDYAVRMILAVVALIPFIVALIARGQPFKSAGWGKENTRIGLLVGLLLAVLTIFLRGKFMTILAGTANAQLGLLAVLLIYSLAEETIFRGYIQLRMESRLGERWGWLATAGIFLLWQLPGRLNVLPFAELWPILVISLANALVLGWIMKKSRHVLAPALYRAISLWVLFF
jgi:membrane protease YdiL (CAAX protease family)